jgi:stage IV sporulation protein FB
VFFEPNETAYDLRWRMFGTPVRVHPMFWLIALVLGYDGTIRLGIGFVLAWVACVFVSILLHEFGHVWMGRLFGSHGHIVLYSFGGLAIGSNQLSRRWQRILVLLAGPGIQLLFWVILWLGGIRLLFFVPQASRNPAAFVLLMLMKINLFWPILNLLPIWPLDGGQVTREVCQAILPERGTAISLGISMVVSGVLAAHALMSSQGKPLLPYVPEFGMFTAFLFAMFCVSSFSALQAENERRRHWERDEWT